MTQALTSSNSVVTEAKESIMMESEFDFCDPKKSPSENAYALIAEINSEKNRKDDNYHQAILTLYAISVANEFIFDRLDRETRGLNRFTEFMIEIFLRGRGHQRTEYEHNLNVGIITNCLQNPLLSLSPTTNAKLKEIVAEGTGDPMVDLQILAYLGQREQSL